MTAYVYILASQKDGVLYIGCTSDLARRITEHKQAAVQSFSRRYYVRKLVHVESYDTLEEALLREKRLKKWNRDWKIRLIEESNPEWKDLADSLTL